MLDEVKRHIVLGINLLRAKYRTHLRKMQVRRAFEPAKTVTPVMLLAVVGVLGLVATVYAAYEVAVRVVPKFIAMANTPAKKEVLKTPNTKVASISEPSDYCMESFPAIPGDEDMQYMIVADKYDRVLHLLKSQNGRWGVIKSYPIAIGANDGRKVTAGDKKTPEGLYFIVGRKEDNEIDKIYGPLSYVLNYPNRQDSVEGRSGQGIWIHGTEPGLVPVDTKGCLELHNNNLVKLSKFLKNGMYVPIIIHSNPNFNLQKDINLEQVWNERQLVVTAKATMCPSSNIAEGDSSSYLKQTVQEIRNDSLSSVSQLRNGTPVVATKPGTTVVATKPGTPVVATKPGTPVVATKPGTPVKPVAMPSVAVKSAPKSVVKSDEAIKSQIEKWRTNWEKENMASYQSCYDTTRFKSDGYNWKTWKDKKTRTFKNYDKISVNISEIKIVVDNDSTASAFFRQKYQSDQFKAENGKKLTLKKCGGNWKITQEITATYKE